MPDEREEPETLEARAKAEMDDLEARLEGFEARVQEIRSGTRMPDPPELQVDRPPMLRKTRAEAKSDQDSYRGLGAGLSAAYALIGVPVVLFFLGKLIDGRVGGTGWSTGLGLLGFCVGLWFAVVTVNRLGSR
jgi:F0F1-type ATP synthase assembly protein I